MKRYTNFTHLAAESFAIGKAGAETEMTEAIVTHVLTIPVEDLAAGTDIAARPIYAVPPGFGFSVQEAAIVPQGDDAGINNSNTCKVELKHGTKSVCAKEYDNAAEDGVAFPDAGDVDDLGPITNGTLATGTVLTLSVTNGETANPPSFLLRVTGHLLPA